MVISELRFSASKRASFTAFIGGLLLMIRRALPCSRIEAASSGIGCKSTEPEVLFVIFQRQDLPSLVRCCLIIEIQESGYPNVLPRSDQPASLVLDGGERERSMT